MTYITRELIIFAGSAVVILANIVNIAVGTTETGFYISIFVIAMFVLAVAATLKKNKKMTT